MQRAKEILGDISRREQEGIDGAGKGRGQIRTGSSGNQLKLFGVFSAEEQQTQPVLPADYSELKELKEKLISVDINNTTPLEALAILNEFRNVVGSG